MPTATESNGIGVQTAVRSAIKFFNATFGDLTLKNVQLEEVQPSKDGKLWLVTIGYNDPQMKSLFPGLNLEPTSLLRARHLRQYKVVRINAKTGEALSVVMRD